MKLSPRAYALVWDAHAWLGVSSAIVLFAVFLLGPFGLYREAFSPWQEPHLRAPVALDAARVVALAQGEVERAAAAGVGRMQVTLPAAHAPWLKVSTPLAEGGSRVEWVHPESGARRPKESDLGSFLYQMHYLKHLPYGTEISGVAALVLLVSGLSGLLLQIGRLRREWARFRPGGALRRVWTDAHKATGVLTLPFVLVYAISGVLLSVQVVWLRAPSTALVFGGESARVEAALSGQPPAPVSGRRAPVVEVGAALAAAAAALPDAVFDRMNFEAPGDAAGAVVVGGRQPGYVAHATRVRVGADGAVRWVHPAHGSTAFSVVRRSLDGLHYAHWANAPVKLGMAMLSLLVAFCVLTGTLMWVDRRAGRRAGDAMARLVVGATAGLCLAVAVMFVANQLLPRGMDARAVWEQRVFGIAWAGAFAVVFVRARPARVAAALLYAAGGLLAGALVVDCVAHGRWPLAPGSGVAVIEAALWVVVVLFVAAGRVVRRVAGRAGEGGAALA